MKNKKKISKKDKKKEEILFKAKESEQREKTKLGKSLKFYKNYDIIIKSIFFWVVMILFFYFYFFKRVN